MIPRSISIRRMTKRDKEIVLKIISESEYLEILPKRIDHYLKEIDYLPVIVELGGNTIGFAIMKKDSFKDKILSISAFALKEGCRHKGFGVKSLTKIIKMAKKKHGINMVRVKIETKNKPAIAFFKKAGFKEKKSKSGKCISIKEFFKMIG